MTGPAAPKQTVLFLWRRVRKLTDQPQREKSDG
jgi:hypothetical protein